MAKPHLHTSLATSVSSDTHLARGVSNPAPREVEVGVGMR